METNELGQKERYQEVERTLVRLVEEVEGIEDGNLRELEQKIYKGVLELGRTLFQQLWQVHLLHLTQQKNHIAHTLCTHLLLHPFSLPVFPSHL